ncbi:carboxypeptidase regulatory-like domain-containing protein [Silvibacterium acidisoli]|uniref:carboxypeptidase regulatory-like domain-containing protein n=1 Tax=Acidobacteriaceae bacterium ZG23-2 TaxID=2883246 RepID=UPI00406D414C
MRLTRSWVFLFLVMLCFAVAGSSRLAVAQVNLGSIQGEVHDTQHAAVPGAKLSLKNESTGIQASSVSGAAGQYNFLNLSPGVYTLTVESQGFSTSVQQHITVGTGSTVAVNVMLKPGGVEQMVTVQADAAHVETESSDIGTVITPAEIKDLPVSLNADMRNPLNFVVLTPGVAGSTPGASPDYRLHFSGSVSYANEVYIDGVPIMETDLAGDIGSNHPPMDAISQFKVINNNQTAQYGLSSGIVSFAFASGTNQFHGSLFEYLQNDALNAAGYVTDALGIKKAPLKQNEFGGTFGGPVYIPKIYKGHDKTFFFVDFTEFKYRPSSNDATLTTIPNAFRNGDFSQLLGPQVTDPTTGAPIFDPAGNPVYSGAIYNPLSAHNVIGPDGNTYTIRDPFPGNIIPSGTAGLSTVSQTVLQSFPQATNNALNNNFVRLQSSKIDEHRLVVKIDEHISEKHAISGSVFTGGYSSSDNGGLNLYDATQTNTPTKQIRFSYNYTHSPTLLNNLNIGFLRDTNLSGPVQPGPGFAALGMQGLPALNPESYYPLIGLGTVQNSIGGSGGSTVAENRYFLNDNVTLLRGSHAFTFGGELRYLQRNETLLSGGSINFASPETALNGTGFINGNQAVSLPASTGDPRASFLFGGTDFSYISYPAESGFRWWQAGLFAQDDWKVRRNLTLNLGLRYDLQIPRTEAHGEVSTMDPTLPNPAAGGLPGAYTFYGNGPGRNGISRIGNIYRGGIQPRIGFAYSPGTDSRTALRGGFAITRPIGNDNNEDDISGALYNTGYSGLATANRPGDVVGSPAYYWDNPYPAASVSGQTLNPGLLVGNNNSTMIHPTAGMPPTQLYWSLQLQQQVSSSIVFNLGYVGMHTYHIGVWSKPNEVNPLVAQQKYGATAAADGIPLSQFLLLPISDPRAAAAGVTSPWPDFESVFGAGATIGQALRPWPQYGDVDNPLNPIASVSYNGMQASLQKRMSQGLTFLLSYTFSKTIGNADSNDGPSSGAENAIYAGSYFQDYYNPKSERSVTSSDIPHVVSLSYTYELPVGQGKKFLNKGGVVNEVVGGWSVSAIHQYQSGRPVHIEYDAVGAANPFFAAGDGYSFRPNIVPHQPFKNPAYRRSCSGPIQQAAGRNPCQFYINPGAFTAPAVGTFGNAPNFISALRVPAYLDEDISISKRFKIYKQSDLQFQANMFNAVNRTIFSDGGDATTYIQNFAPPNLSATNLANSTTVFGIMTSQQNAPRIIQFGLRLEF